MQKRQGNVQKSTIHVQNCCCNFDVLVAIALSDRKVPSLAGINVISRTRCCPRPRTYRSVTINGPVVISVALWVNSMRSVFMI